MKNNSQVLEASAGARLWKKLWYIACFLMLAGLIFYNRYYAHVSLGSSACDAPAADSVPWFYSSLYPLILDWTHNENSAQVREVVIPADLVEIQMNVCKARAYLADLLQTLDAQRPSVIVIDKYFSPDACPADPVYTEKLIKAIGALKTPIVVGESTDTAAKETDDSCLVKKKQLYLGASVLYGLTRLNVNKEEIPLEWNVLPKQPADDDIASVPTESLAMKAARAAAPEIIDARGFRTVRDAERQPYARFRSKIPRETSTDLLCAAGMPELRERWSLNCARAPENVDLLGKVVVIGAESAADSAVVLGQRRWGYELQATYIDALLSGRYLRAPKDYVAVLLFVVFLFGLEAASPARLFETWTAAKAFPHADVIDRFVQGLWTLVFIFAVFLAYFLKGYLPPLVMLLAALSAGVGLILPSLADATFGLLKKLRSI